MALPSPRGGLVHEEIECHITDGEKFSKCRDFGEKLKFQKHDFFANLSILSKKIFAEKNFSPKIFSPKKGHEKSFFSLTMASQIL